MAKKPEAVFSEYLRDHLLNVDISRIESMANLGFPDMVVVGKTCGSVGFVENKVVSRGLQVGLRPHQISFLYRHAQYGCAAHVVVKHCLPGKRLYTINVYNGNQVLALAEEGLRLAPVFRAASDSINWEQLTEILLKGQNR